MFSEKIFHGEYSDIPPMGQMAPPSNFHLLLAIQGFFYRIAGEVFFETY
jgi:hypothetical protein